MAVRGSLDTAFQGRKFLKPSSRQTRTSAYRYINRGAVNKLILADVEAAHAANGIRHLLPALLSRHVSLSPALLKPESVM